MPFLFQRIDDFTELLMPDDLLSGTSIVAYTREAMTPDARQEVEVIGWLYQLGVNPQFLGLCHSAATSGNAIATDGLRRL